MERERSTNEGRSMKSERDVEGWFLEGEHASSDREEGVFSKENPMTKPGTIEAPDTKKSMFIGEMAAADQKKVEETRQGIREMFRRPNEQSSKNLDDITLADIEPPQKNKAA